MCEYLYIDITQYSCLYTTKHKGQNNVSEKVFVPFTQFFHFAVYTQSAQKLLLKSYL